MRSIVYDTLERLPLSNTIIFELKKETQNWKMEWFNFIVLSKSIFNLSLQMLVMITFWEWDEEDNYFRIYLLRNADFKLFFLHFSFKYMCLQLKSKIMIIAINLLFLQHLITDINSPSQAKMMIINIIINSPHFYHNF